MNNTLLYIITVLIWGTTWIGIELQLGIVAPEVSVVYRFGMAAVVLFAWCGVRGLNLRFDAKAHGLFILLGFCLFGLNYVLTYRAQIHLTSAMTAIIFSSVLWLNILLARVLFALRSPPRVLVGAGLGIVGIIVLFAPRIENLSLTDGVFVGSMLALTGAGIASTGNMVSQYLQKRALPVVQSNAWGMLYGTLLTGAYTLSQGIEFNFDWSARYIASLLYLSIFGSIIAFGTYLTLLGRIGAHKVGYAMVMFPVVALFISIAFEGLRIDQWILAGMALVLAGNVFVLMSPKNQGAVG